MEQRTLSAVVEIASSIEQMLIESGGEITPEIEKSLYIVDAHLPYKIDSYAAVIERMDIVSSFYEEKSVFYKKLSDSASDAVKKCKDNLRFAMNALNTNELCGSDIKYKLSPGKPSIIICDENAIDESYKTTETTVKIDKRKILDDITAGASVTGVKVQENFRLTKSVNRARR